MLSVATSSPAPKIKHGRFTSPHLVDRWDCIAIDDEPVTESVFRAVEKRVLQRNKELDIQATEFELLTATAFDIFTQENVDVGVVEVGMGGRLDATNILHDPLVSVVSAISLDHQSFLGDNVVDISSEKAGIFKKDTPVVLGSNTEEVTANLKRIAKRVGTGQVVDGTRLARSGHFRQMLATPGLDPDVDTRLTNASVAATAVEIALKRLGHHYTADDLTRMYEAAAKVQWAGRQQWIDVNGITGYDGPVFLDGAHNAQSFRALYHRLHLATEQRRIIWVIALSQGKDVDEMHDILLSGRPKDLVIPSQFGPVVGMPWIKSTSPDMLKGTEPPAQSVKHALQQACSLARDDGDCLIVVTGSLYLVGDLMRLISS